MTDEKKKPRRNKATGAAEAPASFEAALSRLEEIVARLESGELGLDESLALFEEGVNLSRFCQSKLSEVERKVELVLKGANGEIRTVPFGLTGEEEGDSDGAPAGVGGAEDDDDDGAPF